MQSLDDLAYPNPDDLPPASTTDLLCPADAGVCLVRVPYAPRARIVLLRCPYCAGLWLSRADLTPLRTLADTLARRSLADAAEKPAALLDPDAPVMPPLSLRHRAWSLPVALLWALVWRALPFGRLLPGGVRIPLHELGHATAAWVCGHFAVPIPIGLTLSGQGRSVVLLLGCALVGLGVAGWSLLRRRWVVAAVSLGLLALQWTLTAGLSLDQHRELLLWAGCAGEFVWPTVLAALFYARLPPRARWDLARWLAFPVGVYVLLDQTLLWWATRSDADRIPWGGAFSTDGDMDQLNTAFGWSETALTRGYLRLAAVCWLVLLGVWSVATARAALRSRSD